MNVSIEASGQRILLVDDDVELCQLISQYLAQEGVCVDTVHSGESGLEQSLAGKHAIIVLDAMLPDLDGFEVLRRLRIQSRVPVLMLTARGNEQDRILGLEMGADDYLPKPFNPRELSARLQAILRRTVLHPMEKENRETLRLAVGDVEMDRGARSAWRAGEEINLTTVEFDLLEQFLKAPGAVLSREDLMKTILGREFSPFDRSIDTHVSNLRKKLGPRLDGLERIKGVRGIGYVYVFSSDSRGGAQ
jgi:DNA-binding response OmpR family regulator